MDLTEKKHKSKRKAYCNNCGRVGHVYKKCMYPIMSMGVLAFRISDPKLSTLLRSHLLTFENPYKIDPSGIRQDTPEDLKNFCLYQDKVQVLMIQRKFSLGYLEFLRGRYNRARLSYITFLFEQMTKKEILKISKREFDPLWEEVWGPDPEKKKRDDYMRGNAHFEYLLKKDDEGLSFFISTVAPKWPIPEWGFPKGRRDHKESNLDCGKREFEEESDLTEVDYLIFENLTPFNEELKGTDNVKYKHIYYLSQVTSDKEVALNPTNPYQSQEIGNIGWFTYNESLRLIRSYHISRKRILTQAYLFLMNQILSLQESKQGKNGTKKKGKVLQRRSLLNDILT